MNHLQTQQNNQNVSNGSPCQDLYIYYLNGRIKADKALFQENFIGNWQEEDDSFLFFSSPAPRQVHNLLDCQPQLSYIDSYCMSYEQWLGEVFSTYESGNFRIIPPWETSTNITDDFPAKREILLDPGLVFGTGTHSTTRDCLKALELAAGAMDLNTVIDLGTGTGLLALAAAKLGSERTVAIDLNFLAAQTAARNVRLNHLEDRVLVFQGKAQDVIAYPADLVIANIHYDVMRQIINSEGFLAKKRFIISGLLRSQAKEIAGSLANYPVKILKHWTRGGIWHTFYGKRI